MNRKSSSQPKKAGRRHTLLLYREMMSRTWWPTLLLGSILIAVWWWADAGIVADLEPPRTLVVLGGGIFCLGLGLFALLTRRGGFVQAYPGYFLLGTPFFRLKTSYGRIKEIRPVEFYTLFPPEKDSWATRDFLGAYYKHTAILITLNGFPLSPAILRLFFPRQMLSPYGAGFVLLVPDWMGLSTEIDSFYGNWQQARASRSRETTGRGMYR